MADKALFAPIPLRAMAADLSGLQMRVLACVAAHDRLSLVTGKGQGCRASNERMAGLVGCNFSRLCSTLSELAGLGFLERERDGRHTVYRVCYTADDRLLFGNLTAARKVAVSHSERTGHVAGHSRETAENRQKPHGNIFRETGGRYSVETGEDSSSEDARLAARSPQDSLAGTADVGSDSEAARLGRGENGKTIGANLAKLERAMKAGEPIDRLEWMDWLEGVSETTELDDPVHGWAYRLSDRLCGELTEAECVDFQSRGSSARASPEATADRAPQAVDLLHERAERWWQGGSDAGRKRLARQAGIPADRLRGFVAGSAALNITERRALNDALAAAA